MQNEIISAFEAEKLSLVSYKIHRCSIDTPVDFSLPNVESFSYDHKVNFSFNVDQKLVKSEWNFSIQTESSSENTSEAKANIDLVFFFKSENLDELVQIDKQDNALINNELNLALHNVSYSTARGVLLVLLQNSGLQSFILPIIRPIELITSTNG